MGFPWSEFSKNSHYYDHVSGILFACNLSLSLLFMGMNNFNTYHKVSISLSRGTNQSYLKDASLVVTENATASISWQVLVLESEHILSHF